MDPAPRIGRRRLRILGLLVAPMAIGGWLLAGAALGAGGSSKPTMEVLPKATGLKYGQTVEIKAHHLPKGSGSVAATICGLQDASGKTIAKPGADDCAGANELGTLVVLKQWQSNGEFDTKYTLPASAKKFGKNQRFCDKTHHCALVVADANPNAPAYYIDTIIQFVDQQPFGASNTTKPKTTTTKPKTTTTKPATNGGNNAGNPGNHNGSGNGRNSNSGDQGAPRPGVTGDGSADMSMDPNNPHVHVDGHVGVHPPSGDAPGLPAPGGNPVPPQAAQALGQVCSQLAGAVQHAGGDPSGLLAACSAIESGNGPQQLQSVLQSPNLLCIAGASAWQNNQQVTDACNQGAAAIAPATSALGGAVGPALGNIPA